MGVYGNSVKVTVFDRILGVCVCENMEYDAYITQTLTVTFVLKKKKIYIYIFPFRFIVISILVQRRTHI